MEQQKIILHDTFYIDEEYEQYLKKEKNTLIEKFATQAEQDGDLKQPKTAIEHVILSTNPMQAEIQGLIDHNQAKYLPISGQAIANIIEREANQNIKEHQKELHALERQLPDAQKAVDADKPNLKHIMQRRWVYVLLGFIALAEGFMSYSALRHAGFSTLTSYISSIAIAVIVFLSSHFGGGWLRTAKSTRQYFARCIVILMTAAIGFSILALLRVHAIADVINIQAGSSTATEHHAGPPAVAIAIFSLILYAVGLLVSAYFFRTKEMEMQEQRYKESCKALALLEQQLEEKRNAILKEEKDKVEQMTLAVRRYDYAKSTENSLVNFAQQLSESYKTYNIRHRTDGIPEFYKEKSVFNFILFFNN